MESWSEYIKKLLNTKSDFDNVQIELAGDQPSFTIPPIIKASVLMLDRFQDSGSIRNVFVFPEKDELVFLFTITRIIHNILNGKIGKAYNPDSIPVGTRLKLGNAVVEFRGLETRKNKDYVRVRGDQGEYSFEKYKMPYFQQTDSQRRLSKIDDIKKELVKSGIRMDRNQNTDISWIETLQNYKTHLDNSVYYVAPMLLTKELFSRCVISSNKLNDLLLLGHVDYEGNLANLGTGQLSGIPALTLCNDLYSVKASSEKGNPVQSVIINITNDNSLNKELSYLDDVIGLGKPIVGLCNTVNSIHLDELKKRGFNIWRWNEHTITPELFGHQNIDFDARIKNAASIRISYARMDNDPFAHGFALIDQYKEIIKDYHANIQNAFADIYSILFQEIRCISDISCEARNMSIQKIMKDLAAIDDERTSISPAMYTIFHDALSELKNYYQDNAENQKTRYLKKYIEQYQPLVISIIIPNRFNCNEIKNFWNKWCLKKKIVTKVIVETVSDFLASEDNFSQMVFICGWMKTEVMGKILYGFSASRYTILLYPCEDKWAKYGGYSIRRGLDDGSNQVIAERLIGNSEIHVPVYHIEQNKPEKEQEDHDRSIEEINSILIRNKINRAVSSLSSTGEKVKAVPVTYLGYYMAFYRLKHTIISATKLIEGIKDDIERLTVDELHVGDFVVVSEVEHDLIKEAGDRLLVDKGYEDKIKLASKWRESINVERAFSTDEQILKKFQKAGIKHSRITFENWLNDKEMIAPQTKQDIVEMAKSLNDTVLMEMADDIFSAAELVRNSRKIAGRELADDLRREIADQLGKMREIDPVNIWEPIALNINGFGKIMILKVIDISPVIMIDSARTDHLLRDEE